jgi:large subunit ribosomal protein L27
MAHKKQGGKASQHVSPAGKRLGVKVAHGQQAHIGMVLVRQRGTLFHAGKGASVGRDHTLFALTTGTINFGKKLGKRVVSII